MSGREAGAQISGCALEDRNRVQRCPCWLRQLLLDRSDGHRPNEGVWQREVHNAGTTHLVCGLPRDGLACVRLRRIHYSLPRKRSIPQNCQVKSASNNQGNYRRFLASCRKKPYFPIAPEAPRKRLTVLLWYGAEDPRSDVMRRVTTRTVEKVQSSSILYGTSASTDRHPRPHTGASRDTCSPFDLT